MVIIIGSLYAHGGGGLVEVVLLVPWVRSQGHSFMLSLAAAMALCRDICSGEAGFFT